MKLLNTHYDSLVHLFGEEGVAMLESYNIWVCLATKGMFPGIDKWGDAGGAAVKIDPVTRDIFLTPEGGEMALIIYPDVMIKDARQGIPEEMRQRYYRSYLVHELKHIDQYQEGRLEIVKEGQMRWEGKLMASTMEGYLQAPWELEAYRAQFTYLFEGNEDLVQQCMDRMANHQMQAAA